MTRTATFSLLLSASVLLLPQPACAAVDAVAIDAPGTIPHVSDVYLPITVEVNWCLRCHHPAPVDGTPNKIDVPRSHYDGGRLSGERYECMLCHAPNEDSKDVYESEDANDPIMP